MIEIQEAPEALASLVLRPRVGDVLSFRGTGGHVLSGGDSIEMLGAFLSACLGGQGEVMAPEGFPDHVLFRALKPGQAKIDVMTGDPLHSPSRTTLDITVGR